MTPPLRIANAQAFWGDDPDAPARVVEQTPALDYLTLDYLAEVSMSILARQREKNPALGYAKDFVDVIGALARYWKTGRKFRVVSNAGGLNPRGCASACAAVLRDAGCGGMKIGVVTGDDVMDAIRSARRDGSRFENLEDGRPIDAIGDALVTANAYLGAGAIAEALAGNADVIITGRVADPSLTVAPCLAHFGWAPADYHQIAGATVAGHLIECGTQVTGGISTDWLNVPGNDRIGFPIAEVFEDGSCAITKPAGTGGRVDEHSVKEQLLYEIGDPGNYLSPDAAVSLLSLSLRQEGPDRVRVSGAIGREPPPTYKVSATYRAGYRAAGMLTIFGRDAAAKARRCGQIVRQRLMECGCEPQTLLIEVLGAGAVAPGVIQIEQSGAMEVVLRMAASDRRREVVEAFSRRLALLVSAGPQGVTGYAEGRPPVRELFGYWPTLIDRARVIPRVQIMEV